MNNTAYNQFIKTMNSNELIRQHENNIPRFGVIGAKQDVRVRDPQGRAGGGGIVLNNYHFKRRGYGY